MAILLTSRGFHYPDGAQDPDLPRDFGQLAADIDGQFITVATVGALPAAGKPGRRAYVTGDGTEHLDTGSAWVQINMRQVRTALTFNIVGAVASGAVMLPQYVGVASGETAKIVEIVSMMKDLGSGNNLTVDFFLGGTGLAGNVYNTTRRIIQGASVTANSVSGGTPSVIGLAIPIGDGQWVGAQVASVAGGSPANLALGVIVEHTI